jgi:hypothetical protein
VPDEANVQVEIVDDTPEEEKPRLEGGDTSKFDLTNDEIKKYGRDVQQRMKSLRFAFHEERRIRAAAERTANEAAELARRLYDENRTLRSNGELTEQALLDQAISRVEAQLIQAQRKMQSAYEEGKADEMVKANEEVAQLISERERLRMARPVAMPPLSSQPEQAQAPPAPHARTVAWKAENPWFEQPGEEEATAFVKLVAANLERQGINVMSDADLYFRKVNERLAQLYPERFGNRKGQGASGAASEPQESRMAVVAGGTRSNGGAASTSAARVVRLKPSQVALANKFGITAEQYAQELLAIEEEKKKSYVQ